MENKYLGGISLRVNPYKIVDSHCDTITFIEENNLNFYDNKISHITLKKMLASNIKIQFMAIYIDYTIPFPNCYFEALKYINKLYEYEKMYDQLKIIKNKKDLEYVLKNDTIIGVIITIEGGHIIDDQIEIVKSFHLLGIKSITLAWNFKNKIGYGAMEKEDFGLSKLGKEVVKLMEDLNMIVDVSHVSEKTFWDVASIAEKPIIASHSLSRYTYDHKRNLSDDQIKKIADLKGIIGINFYKEFVGNTKDIPSLIDHIERIIHIGGDSCIGIGSDFDGCDVIDNLPDSTYTYLIGEALLKRNYSENTVIKIFSANYLHFLKYFLSND